MIAYGRAASGVLVLHGPRGVGKTSLLDAAVTGAREDHGFITAWTACQRGEPFLADVASRVERALAQADLLGKKARLAVEKVVTEVTVPAFARFSAELTRPAADRPTPPAGAISAVEDMLHEASELARGGNRRRGTGLIVAIDELHAGQVGELAVLLNAIQNLHHDSANNALAVLGAGIPAVRGLLPSAATFGERSRWREVAPLDEPALRELLTAPAAEMKVSWHPDAVRAVLDASEQYPHFVHILGEGAWLAARPSPGGQITPAHATSGIERGRAEINDLYAARWASATPAQQAVLVAIAELAGDGAVERVRVERHLSGRDISKTRAALMDKNAIDIPDHGLMQFTLPGFARFVLDQSGTTPSSASPLAPGVSRRPALPPPHPPGGGPGPELRHFVDPGHRTGQTGWSR